MNKIPYYHLSRRCFLPSFREGKTYKQIRLIMLILSNMKNGEKTMKRLLIFCIFCFAFVLVFNFQQICAAAGNNSTAKAGEKWSGWVLADAYKIGSGDILSIVTWKEPDFSRQDVLVRTDGKISFPLLGDVQAAGRTPMEIKKEIESGLKAYVENPIVTVTVKSPESQKFYILGEVKKTGEYPLIKGLTVLQAFAIAGGFTDWASKKEIILLRHENGKEKVYNINYKKIVNDKDIPVPSK
jgi:polysaccharide export outer membrane protein